MKKLLGVMAIANMLFENPNSRRSYEPKPIEPLPPKSKLFIIHGEEIYALNQKNAIRKYNNLINKK